MVMQIAVDFEVWKALTIRRSSEAMTYNDVLRGMLGLEPATGTDSQLPASQQIRSDLRKADGRRGRGSHRIATETMSPRIEGDRLVIEFERGERNVWKLPVRTDKQAIRRIRAEAIEWASSHGASNGQVHHIMKTLTDGGFYLTGPRRGSIMAADVEI